MSINRRSFLKNFLAESISTIDELRGIPQYRLDEIQNLPDHILKDIVPVSRKQDTLCIKGNHLNNTNPKENAISILRTFTPKEMDALDLFNGQNSLQSIATELSKRNHTLNPEEAFVLVKTLFCDLARLMVYIPAGRHERDLDNH